MSSQLADFLNEHNLTADQIVAESKAAEALSQKDREAYVKRADARRTKKSYEDVEAAKPGALRRGISIRMVKLAIDGQPVTRVSRKKITRAVEKLLKNETEVTVLKLFGDVRSRNHKKTEEED